VLVPQNTAASATPAVSFAYFDPDRKTYATLRREGTPLVIRPAGAEPQMIGLPAGNTPNTNAPPVVRDIVPNKESPGAPGGPRRVLPLQPWFVGLESVPILAWAGLFAWRRRENALLNNPRFQRRKHVQRLVDDGIGQLNELARSNNAPEFYGLLFRLLQELLGERLDIPAGAITEAILDERRAALGLSEGSVNELHGLFQTCDVQRYAPASNTHQLVALAETFQRMVTEMRKVRT
jgi:hypothetical protein